MIKNYKNIPVFPNPLYNFASDKVTTIIPENYADNSYLRRAHEAPAIVVPEGHRDSLAEKGGGRAAQQSG